MTKQIDQASGKPQEISDEVKFKARNMVDKARAKLLLKQPFYGVLLAQANVNAATEIPTLGTDGVRIYYNPQFISEMSEQELNGVLMHEISHCVYLHCSSERRLNRDRHRWNIATDYAINLEIAQMPQEYQLPDMALLDRKYDGMNAEQIYDSLPKDVSDKSTLDMHIEPMDGTEDWDDMEDRIIAAYESTKDFYDNEKNNGKLPAGMRAFIEKMRKAKVSWERIFHRYIGQALARDDFSYIRCNRRYLPQDIYLPALRNHVIGSVVLAIDTSGSVSKQMLEQFAAELAKVSHLVDEVTVMTCDADVQEVVKIHKMENFMDKLHFKGRGGTDFRPVFKKVEEMRLDQSLDLLIFLSDLFGPVPEKHPPYPVLWCLTEDHGDVPWGKSVVIPEKKDK